MGHLRAAEEVWEAQGLDEVWFMPAAIPPHKEQAAVAPFRDRLIMAQLATGTCPHFLVSDIEGLRPGPSYSVDTIAELRRIHGQGPEFFFMLGSDAFQEIETWKDYPRLTQFAHLVVFGREAENQLAVENIVARAFPEYTQTEGGHFRASGRGEILWQKTTRLAISGTDIRGRCLNGRSIRFLVPEPVRRYVEEHRLYDWPSKDEERVSKGRDDVEHHNTSGAEVHAQQRPVKAKAAEDVSGPEPPSDEALARLVADLVLDNKGEEVVGLDLRGLSSLTDYFVIAQGHSTRHVQGMMDKIRGALRERGVRCRGIEGENEGKWVLMDYGEVILHLFYEPVRDFYDLEGLWSEAPRLDIERRGA